MSSLVDRFEPVAHRSPVPSLPLVRRSVMGSRSSIRPRPAGRRRARSVRAAVVLLAAPAAALLLGATTAFANVALTQVSTDPYTDTQAQHHTEVEPDTFAFGSTVVSAFQVGRVS